MHSYINSRVYNVSKHVRVCTMYTWFRNIIEQKVIRESFQNVFGLDTIVPTKKSIGLINLH